MSTKGPYPFADKEAQYKGYSEEMLQFAVKDAAKARDCVRDFDPVAESWYTDDVSTIRAEINRREAKRVKRSVR